VPTTISLKFFASTLVVAMLSVAFPQMVQARTQQAIATSLRVTVQTTPVTAVTLTAVASGATLMVVPYTAVERDLAGWLLVNQLKPSAIVVLGTPLSQMEPVVKRLLRSGRPHIFLAPLASDKRSLNRLSTVLGHQPYNVAGIGKLSVSALGYSERSRSCAVLRIESQHITIGIAYAASLSRRSGLAEADDVLILQPEVLPQISDEHLLSLLDPDVAIVLSSRARLLSIARGEDSLEALRESWIDVYTVEAHTLELSAGPYGLLLPSVRSVR